MYNQYSPYAYPQNYGNYNYPQRGYAPQPQQMVQPQTQPQTQIPTAYETPIQDIRFVTNKEAEAYIIYPNSRVLLLDTENGVAHLKTADAMGKSTTQYFKFTPISADGTPIKPPSAQPSIDLSDYIKRTDLEQLGLVTADQFKAMEQRLEALQRQIATGGRQNVAPRTPQQ